MDYQKFIQKKSERIIGDGFDPLFIPDFLFDFQKHLVDWAIKTGRSAIFADCGMGKTPMQLVWAENVIKKTNKPVLILAPLSVSLQTVEEAEKFDIEAARSMNGKFSGVKVITTNYERLHYFNADDFAGVVCDESSIIKNFDGKRKKEITNFLKKIRYRLLCTATAAPNDYIELGTSSEALGYIGYMDMLSMFFRNEEDSLHPAFIGSQWRFKRHAEKPFWRWLSSWARACRKPSDMGFCNGDFVLPELIEDITHIKSPVPDGCLFEMPAITLAEQRADTKATIVSRCEKAAESIEDADSAIAWCHLNAESDLLTDLIDGSVSVSGSDKDERKDEVFSAFKRGDVRVLVTKPKIAAFGMNWQHCARMAYFPTHSFEQYYQSIRRCWRFGQTKPVKVDVIASTGQLGVFNNLSRKSTACAAMFASLIDHMNEVNRIDRINDYTKSEEMPSWL